MHRFLIRLAAVFACSVFALGLTACFAMSEDVTEARKEARAGDDAIRADLAKATEAQRDAFRDFLIEHPGDVAGAAAHAFGVHAKVTATTNETAGNVPPPKDESGGLPGWLVAAIAAVTGGGGIGAWLLKRHDDKPFVGSKGQTVSEAALVDGLTAPPKA